MDEFAIGHGEEEREDEAEMECEERAHRSRGPEDQERQAGKARQEQHGDEGRIHAEKLRVAQRRLAPELAAEETDAPANSEQNRKVVPRIGRRPAERMIDRRDARGCKAGEETVERKMMI